MKSTATGKDLLGDIAGKLFQNAANFAWPKLFPLFLTNRQGAEYYVLSDKSFIDIPLDIQRAPTASASRSKTTLDADNFLTREFAHEELLSHREIGKYGNPEKCIQGATRRVSNIVSINSEVRAKAKATANTVPSATPATKWDAANSTPLADVIAARQAIFDGCGEEANVMSLPRQVYEALKQNAEILARIQIGAGDSRWPLMLAALFDVDEIVVARAFVNGAEEGQTLNVSQVWGDSVILAHVDQTEDLMATSFGRTFLWADTKTPDGLEVDGYDDQKNNGVVIRCAQCVDEKVSAAKAGYHLSDVLS